MAAAIAMTIGLSACASGDGAETSGDSDATLVVAARKTPNGLDHDVNVTPEDHQIRAAIHDKLLALGPGEIEDGVQVRDFSESALEGRLAESWEVSDDNRTITIKLREGVISAAGNELTAEDVQWTWDRSWETDGIGSFYVKTVLGMDEPNWRVIDKYTWELTTPRPNALTTLLLTNNDLDILDSKLVQEHATEDDPWAFDWMSTNGAGFGAYRVTGFEAGQQVTLEANENYYRGEPAIKKIIYRAVPEDSNRLALVQSGQADIAEWLAPQFVRSAQGDSAVRSHTTSGNTMMRLDFNWNIEPFDNREVRRALLYAIPYDRILEDVYQGLAEPSSSPVPSTYPGYDGQWDIYEYDPDKAKALLEEQGFAGLEFDLVVDAGDQTQRDSAVILKDAMAAAGVTVNIKEVSAATFTTELYSGTFPANFQPSFPILPDAGYALLLYYPCGSALNATGYCNETFEGLLADANATFDPTERDQLFSEAQRVMIQDDAQAGYIAEVAWNIVTDPKLQGMNWDTPNIYSFFDLSFAP